MAIKIKIIKDDYIISLYIYVIFIVNGVFFGELATNRKELIFLVLSESVYKFNTPVL
jgi:hypothetical protein